MGGITTTKILAIEGTDIRIEIDDYCARCPVFSQCDYIEYGKGCRLRPEQYMNMPTVPDWCPMPEKGAAPEPKKCPKCGCATSVTVDRERWGPARIHTTVSRYCDNCDYFERVT